MLSKLTQIALFVLGGTAAYVLPDAVRKVSAVLAERRNELMYKMAPPTIVVTKMVVTDMIKSGRRSLGMFMPRSRFVWSCLAIGGLVIVGIRYTPFYIPLKERLGECAHMALSQLISYGRVDTTAKDVDFKKSFRELDNVKTKPTSGSHPHPERAKNRAAAEAMIRALAQTVGYSVFSHQCSNRDVKRGVGGSRDYWWMKDTVIDADASTPEEREIVQIVDTDYYMNMSRFLIRNSNPVILYTMQPTKAGEVNDSGMSYYFNEDNDLVTNMAGGADYSHRLWNYGVDVVTVRSYFGWYTKTYLVEKRYLSHHHCLVFLIPQASWRGVWSYLTMLLKSDVLEELRPVHDGWVSIEQLTYNDHTISIAPVGSCASAEIPMEIYSGLIHSAKASKHPITVASVESQVKPVGLTHAQAAMLCNYFVRKVDQPRPMVYPVRYAVKTYQFYTGPSELDLDAKNPVTAFMSPIINGAFTPAGTEANERRCVAERIEKLKRPILEKTPELIGYMEEFTKLLVPEPGILVPDDEDAVLEKQNRPRQKRTIADASMLDEPKRVCKSFQKKECYGKLNDPRNISTINAKDKLEYSKLMYPFARLLKNTTWYAFGKPPREIAERVAEICNTANWVVPSDYERLDGTVNNLCRDLEEAIVLRAYHTTYVERVRKAMRTQHHLDAYGTHGTSYETEWSRLSGSPETSAFNTMDTAFVAYVAYRLMGLTVEEAWARLGIFGGDDGLTANMDLPAYEKAAGMMGLKLKAEKILSGSRGVMFLARKYTSDVWVGEVTSCCDIQRQLMKFHTAVNLQEDVTPEQKLVEKAYSYYLTDKNTPIIGPYVSRVYAEMQKTGIAVDPLDNPLGIRTFSSLVDEEDQYPNEPHNDFMVYALEVVPHFEEDEWNTWLASCGDMTALLSPPCLKEMELSRSGVAVNGEAPPLDDTPPPVDVTPDPPTPAPENKEQLPVAVPATEVPFTTVEKRSTRTRGKKQKGDKTVGDKTAGAKSEKQKSSGVKKGKKEDKNSNPVPRPEKKDGKKKSEPNKEKENNTKGPQMTTKSASLSK